MRKNVLAVPLTTGVLAGSVAGIALATSGLGVPSTTLAQGNLEPVDLRVRRAAGRSRSSRGGSRSSPSPRTRSRRAVTSAGTAIPAPAS